MTANNIRNTVAFFPSIPPNVYSASFGGATVDTQGCENVAAVVQLGALANTATLTVRIQEADASGGPFTDVAGSTLTVDTTADDSSMKMIEVRAQAVKRWVKITMAYGGSGNVNVGASIALANFDRAADEKMAAADVLEVPPAS